MNPPGQAENMATTMISWQMEPATTRTMIDPHRSWPRLLAAGNHPCGTRPSPESVLRNPVASLASMKRRHRGCPRAVLAQDRPVDHRTHQAVASRSPFTMGPPLCVATVQPAPSMHSRFSASPVRSRLTPAPRGRRPPTPALHVAFRPRPTQRRPGWQPCRALRTPMLALRPRLMAGFSPVSPRQ